MKTSKYPIAFMLLFLSACSVSKNIEKPQIALPENFRNAGNEDTASIADVQWKRFFTDASLQKIIDSAIAKNYDMQIALKNIETAQLTLTQTKYAYLPDAKLQLGASVNRPSDNSLNGLSLSQFLGKSYVEDYSTSINLSWEADIWGKIKNQKSRRISVVFTNNRSQKRYTNKYCCQCCTRVLQLANVGCTVSDSTKKCVVK